jgi:hypothetical protein
MGYYTVFTGQIDITPEVPWGLIKDSDFVLNEEDPYSYIESDVRFYVREEASETFGGAFIKKSSSAIVPTWEDECRGRYILEHVQKIIELLGPFYFYSGYISAEGEDTGDMWRIYVINGKATKIVPEIVWPDIENGGN